MKCNSPCHNNIYTVGVRNVGGVRWRCRYKLKILKNIFPSENKVCRKLYKHVSQLKIVFLMFHIVLLQTQEEKKTAGDDIFHKIPILSLFVGSFLTNYIVKYGKIL